MTVEELRRQALEAAAALIRKAAGGRMATAEQLDIGVKDGRSPRARKARVNELVAKDLLRAADELEKDGH